MTPRAMLCSTRDIPAKNVRLRRALITRIGGINLARMFNSPARPHTHTHTHTCQRRRGVFDQDPGRCGAAWRALIRTWDKKLFLYHHATCACTLSPLPRVYLRMINVITHALRPVVYRELHGVAWRGLHARRGTLNTERKEVEMAATAARRHPR